MATVNIDTLKNLSMVERVGAPGNSGVIMELRREVMVIDLELEDPPDYRILQTALNQVNAGGGVDLSLGSPAFGHPDLLLVERSPRLVPGTTTTCVAELLYKRHGTSLETLALGDFLVRGGGSLRQFTTFLNQFGADNVVCYTYPAKCVGPSPCGGPGQPDCCVEDPAYPFTDPRLAGKTVCLSGEVQVDLPSDTLEFTGRLETSAPGQLVRTWRGHTNSNTWNDGAPGTWRCAEVTFDPWDTAIAGSEQWVFNFFFQYDPTGWNPDAIFRNQLTGKTPPDIVEGNGVIEVDWYPTLDFASLFPP